MAGTPKSLERLALEFQRLPGIGAKSAARLAYYLLRSPEEEAQRLAGAIAESRAAVRRCSVCNTLTEDDPCEICANPERDASLRKRVTECGEAVREPKLLEGLAAGRCDGHLSSNPHQAAGRCGDDRVRF